MMDTQDLDPKDPLDKAWMEVSAYCGIVQDQSMSQGEISEETLKILDKEKLGRKTCQYIQAHFNSKLRDEIVPKFWNHFTSSGNDDSDIFVNAVNDLYMNVLNMSQWVTRLEALSSRLGLQCDLLGQNSYPDVFKLMLKSTLHSQLPNNLEPHLSEFYKQAFIVFYGKKEKMLPDFDDSANDDFMGCSGCGQESDSCECNAILQRFHGINSKLIELDILERMTSSILISLIHDKIEDHVLETCRGSFMKSHVVSLLDWLDLIIMAFVRSIFTANESVMNSKTEKSLNLFRKKLISYVYEVYTHSRIDQLFNIIIEFPDTQPALEDLRECLAETNLRPYFTETLKTVLENKLKHCGVNTTDLLTGYICSIKALRVLDPSGVILDNVCEPIRKYLRTREDTVQCIVKSMINDSEGELADELKQNEGLCMDESFEEESMTDWEDWVPDPIDAAPERKSHHRRTSDIISMLVNIYGSKEIFVEEYRSLLSNRLLNHLNYETEREIRNLELLKLRFGEGALFQCEVMLKDISDSKRINALLRSDGNNGSISGAKKILLDPRNIPVNAFILSAQFWPQFKDEMKLNLPVEVERALEAYTKAFEDNKGNRTLIWQKQLGFANIDIQIGDKKINLTVSPVHAAIISQFQVKAQWHATELAKSVGISVATLRKKVTLWQTHGLIREVCTDRYCLIEDGPMRRLSEVSGAGLSSGTHVMDDDESESVTRTSRDQREDELQVFWSYIVNMLTNLGSLPLERILQMLNIFAPQGVSGVECDTERVRQFLDRKVREHELVFSCGQYKLSSKN